MKRIEYFVQKHPDLFAYQKAVHVNPHDRLIEKYILRFLPQDITPNRITALRIILTPVVFFLILYEYYQIGAVLFLLTAFTDALDGSLARTKDQITKFGIMFDPLADKLLSGSMVLLLVFRYFPPWLGLTILGVEIIFIISGYISNRYFKIVRMANIWGKIKMWLQVIATFLVMLALVFNFSLLFTISFWLFGFAIGFAILSLLTRGI